MRSERFLPSLLSCPVAPFYEHIDRKDSNHQIRIQTGQPLEVVVLASIKDCLRTGPMSDAWSRAARVTPLTALSGAMTKTTKK